PEVVYNNLKTRLVAVFRGSSHLKSLDDSVTESLLIVHSGESPGKLPYVINDIENVDIGIRTEYIDIAGEDTGLPMTVNHVELMGAELHVHGTVNDKEIVVRADPSRKINVNDQVFLKMSMDKVHLFDVESKEVLSEREKVDAGVNRKKPGIYSV